MTTLFTSDTHLYHENSLKFMHCENKEVYTRPFDDIHEMNEYAIDQWNSVVKPEDKLIHVGDVAFAVKKYNALELLNRMNGKKTLIMGNHDQYGKIELYSEYFNRIYGSMEFTLGGLRGIVTHIPVHPSQLEERFAFNIHGHLHDAVIPDPRYFNVSVEQNDFKPFTRYEIEQTLYQRGVL